MRDSYIPIITAPDRSQALAYSLLTTLEADPIIAPNLIMMLR